VKVDDPAYVVRQYATEHGLAARKSIYAEIAGDDPREIAFEAVAEISPRTVLEVGCGEGELAERMTQELGAAVLALDQSERMVELTRARGVEALVGDAQDLPFDDHAFDVVVAAWMLFHLPDVDRGLAELSRVLVPGGRLVAVTNYADHLAELFAFVGAAGFTLTFEGENGAELLSRHFARVERRDAYGSVTIRDAEAIRAYLRSSERLAEYADDVPDLDAPLVARRRNAVFVAEKAW
jgi:SAM-dependent methyltransferase